MSESYKTAASLAIGVVAASLVLFPSALSVVQKPLVAHWAMWAYLSCSIAALPLLSFAYYIAAFTTRGPPHRSIGIGNVLAMAALACFAFFLFANLRSDQRSPPRIISATADKYKVAPGEVMTLTGSAMDEDGDALSWRWQVAPAGATGAARAASVDLPGRLQTTAWRVPDSLPSGLYRITVRASDGARDSATESFIVEIRK